MMIRIVSLALVLLATLLGATGCASMSDVTRAHANNNGTVAVYEVDEARAWQASKEVLKAAGAEAVEEKKEEHAMYASFDPAGFEGGTVFGAWIEPVDATHVRVTAVSKRKYQLSLATRLTETGFQENLAKSIAASRGPVTTTAAKP